MSRIVIVIVVLIHLPHKPIDLTLIKIVLLIISDLLTNIDHLLELNNFTS
jgi:hypothetical protein